MNTLFVESVVHVGVTGTRYGMTKEQKEAFRMTWKALQNLYPSVVFHHGDCVGVDEEAHGMVHRRIREGMDKIIIHPPVDSSLRASCANADRIEEEKTHLARNRDIVNTCKILIVVPFQAEHQSRGGTWYTYDYGLKKGRTIYLIKPDGSIT